MDCIWLSHESSVSWGFDPMGIVLGDKVTLIQSTVVPDVFDGDEAVDFFNFFYGKFS